jgi:hypothetical protein
MRKESRMMVCCAGQNSNKRSFRRIHVLRLLIDRRVNQEVALTQMKAKRNTTTNRQRPINVDENICQDSRGFAGDRNRQVFLPVVGSSPLAWAESSY